MYYDNFFKLIGWEAEEIEKARPRIEKTLAVFEVTEEDLKRGEERVKKYFDMELKGMQKIFALVWKELIRLVHAREDYKYVVYGDWPALNQPLMSMDQVPDVYVGTPGQVVCLTLGQHLDKLTPILEAGERAGLPPGEALCGLYQIRLGLISLQKIPAPDLIISGSFYCDVPTYADDLVRHTTGARVFYTDRCLDSQWGEFPDVDEKQVQYFGERIRESFRVFAEVTGTTLTLEQEKAGIIHAAKVWKSFQPLVYLAANDPTPLSQTNMNYVYFVLNSAIGGDVDKIIDMLAAEVKERVDRRYGIMPKGAPVVYLALPYGVDPLPIRMIEDCGLRIATMCVNYLLPEQMTKSKHTDYWDRTSEGICKYANCHSTEGYIYQMKKTTEIFKCDGALIGYSTNCRPQSIYPIMAKKEIQEKLGVPALIFEGDTYDTRSYGSEQLRTRVETFAELLKMAKS